MTAEAPPTLYLMVGLPASGKTTRARQVESANRALRLSPDEWMIPLFGESEAGGKRDVLEGRLIRVGLRALELGVNVVLDFGLWGRDERSALRWLATRVGAHCQLEHLAVAEAVQLSRAQDRLARTPAETFAISAAELARWRAHFEPPDAAELSGSPVGEPPSPHVSWSAWAAERWPSLGEDP